MLVTSREGWVQEVNARLLARTGLARKAATGRAATELFDLADRKRLAAAMTKVLSRRQPLTIEAGLVTADGPSPIELNISPRLDDRGRGVGLVLLGRPVGERRQACEKLGDSRCALQEAQSQLASSENLDSLERHATKLEAYFIRVQDGAGWVQLAALREELNLDPELGNLRAAMQGVRDGTERLRDIGEDLRRPPTAGWGEMVLFDLVETTRVATAWVLRGTKDAPKVATQGEARLMVRGRPGHIQQAVMNLVQNAVDALKGRDGAALTLAHRREGGMAMLEVADNGSSVPESAHGAIFDPFFTTKSVGQRIGLGLSISRRIAEEHGGALRLVDGSEGVTFRLTLPMEED